jgi:hypothetical protein
MRRAGPVHCSAAGNGRPGRDRILSDGLISHRIQLFSLAHDLFDAFLILFRIGSLIIIARFIAESAIGKITISMKLQDILS